MNTSSIRIKERREELGISQEELAERIGMNQTQVSRYETGESDPKSATLATIAQVLGVTSDWLLGLEDRELDALSQMEREALKVFRSAPTDKQANLIEIMRLAS